MPEVLKLHSQLLFCPIYYALKASIVTDELPVAMEGRFSVLCVTQCVKLILCKTMLSLHRLERKHCRFFLCNCCIRQATFSREQVLPFFRA